MGNKTAGDKLKSFRFFYLFCTILLVFALASGCNSGGRGGADGSWNPLPNASEIDEIVTGVITDSDGKGVVGAEVRFLKNDVVVQSVKTTTGGKFQALLAPGTYDVLVIQDNYAPTQQTFVVAAKLANTLNAVVSSTVGFLVGSVKDARTGIAVVGAKVTLTVRSNPTLLISPVYTDTTGAMKFSLATGTYDISVTADGYASATGSVDIVADSTVTRDFVMAQTSGRVYGLVLNQSGQLQEGTLIRLVPSAAGSSILDYTTTADGKYSFFVPEGNIELIANKDGFDEYRWTGSLVAGSEQLHDIKLSLPPSAPVKGMVKGVVKLTTTGEVLPNINITVTPQSGDKNTARSTVQGEFAFENYSPGSYNIYLRDDNNAYRAATYTVQLLNDGTLVPEEPEFFLSPMVYDDLSQRPPMAVATGTIKDSFTKSPLQYVNCMLKGVKSCISDLNGAFSFEDLIPGSYEIIFTKSGWQDLTVNFVVKANADGTTASIFPPILSYEMVQNQETDVGAITGRYIDETTGLGINGLIVRVYTLTYAIKTIEITEAGVVSFKEVGHWEVSGRPILSTRTGTDLVVNQEYAGSFRLEHLYPSSDDLRYFVYVGNGSSYLPTYNFIDPADQGVTKQVWLTPDLDFSNPNLIHAWNDVPVTAQTTTYLENYNLPNY